MHMSGLPDIRDNRGRKVPSCPLLSLLIYTPTAWHPQAAEGIAIYQTMSAHVTTNIYDLVIGTSTHVCNK